MDDDKLTPPDSERGAQPGDKQAERDARRARRQAERQAERDAAKAARKAERQAARKAERQAQKAQGVGADAKPSAAPGKTCDTDGLPAAADGSAAAPVPARDPVDSRAAKTASPAATGTRAPHPQQDFDILIVAQGGGIDRQAAVLAASLRLNAPGFRGRLIVAEPQQGGAWRDHDPRMSGPARAALTALGAEIRPLTAQRFGQDYPHGNKIEALGLADPGRPFLFLDSDTLILGEIGAVPFDFNRPSASMRREGTWPELPPYRQTYASIWGSLYDRFGLDMAGSLDLSQPEEHWERFLYFNAGWFFGPDAVQFGQRFTEWAVAVRNDPGEALACQSLDPWLDQAVLPLVIHSFGGGRPGPELDGMDGDVTCHYRNLPLLYARASDAAVDSYETVAALPEIAPLLESWEPARRLIAEGQGRRRIRPIFADERADSLSGDGREPAERPIRKRLKAEDLWLL